MAILPAETFEKTIPSIFPPTGIRNYSPITALRIPLNSNVLGVKISDQYSTAELPSKCSFFINSKDFAYLHSVQKGRMFAKYQLQHVLLCVADWNKFCVFIFDRHQISNAKTMNKRKCVPYFKASAHCKFDDCPVMASLKMEETLSE